MEKCGNMLRFRSSVYEDEVNLEFRTMPQEGHYFRSAREPGHRTGVSRFNLSKFGFKFPISGFSLYFSKEPRNEIFLDHQSQQDLSFEMNPLDLRINQISL